MSNKDLSKALGVNSGAREGQAVFAWYKTPAVLVKSAKSRDSDGGKKTST